MAAAVFDDSNGPFRRGTIVPDGRPFIDTQEHAVHALLGSKPVEKNILKTIKGWAGRANATSKEQHRTWAKVYEYTKAHFNDAHFIIVQGGKWPGAIYSQGP